MRNSKNLFWNSYFYSSSYCSGLCFNYQHLLMPLQLTYLKGETSATIDDGVDFPSRNIEKGVVQPWQTDSLYNKTSLPKNIVDNLKSTNSVYFL